MSSPSKRRRTSPTTYIGVSDQENHEHAQPRPSTPKRASYQSPTKASLARSNPGVLQQVAQAKQRRESEPNRRQSLLDAVLGNKRTQPEDGQEHVEETRATDTSTAVPLESGQDTQTATLANDIADAFRDAPGPNATLPDSRPQEITRQTPNYSPRRNEIPTFTSPSIVPRLVKSTSTSQQQARRSTSAELPPTPVQLGSDSQPSRPRGLASSSPGGSGRRRVRIRGGHVTSSPLKPKAPAPAVEEPQEDLDHAEIASGIEDDLEEEVQNQSIEGVEDLEETDDPTIRDKQQQLRSLQMDLKALQEQYDKLQTISKDINQNKSKTHAPTNLDENLTFLLNSLPPPKETWPPRPEDHPLFQKHPQTYLTLFSPGNLRMSYQCWEDTNPSTTKTKGQAPSRNTFVCQTTFAAPEPWPPSTLNLTFDVITDQDTCEIVKIVFANNKHQPIALQNWINDRLQRPVFKTDLATIMTGVGRYFEEDVKRASIYKYLTEKLTTSTGAEQRKITLPVQSRQDALALLSYLNTTQQSFSPTNANTNAQTLKRTRHSLGSAGTRQMMLTYDITLNWIGQPRTHVDICTSGFSNDATQHARKLFGEIEAVDGVCAAFEGVWEVLGMKDTVNADGVNGSEEVVGGGKGRGKGRKKARRMTEFESPVKASG